jgi:hypothetical protein
LASQKEFFVFSVASIMNAIAHELGTKPSSPDNLDCHLSAAYFNAHDRLEKTMIASKTTMAHDCYAIGFSDDEEEASER